MRIQICVFFSVPHKNSRWDSFSLHIQICVFFSMQHKTTFKLANFGDCFVRHDMGEGICTVCQ